MDMEARAHSEHPEALRLWLRLLTCTQLVEKQVRSRLRERFDTTLPRFDLMAQLERAPDGLKMNELSRRMMVTGGNVTGITDQLVAEGWWTASTSRATGAPTACGSRPRGASCSTTWRAQHEDWIVEAFSGLTDKDIATLHRLLGKVKDHATRRAHGRPQHEEPRVSSAQRTASSTTGCRRARSGRSCATTCRSCSCRDAVEPGGGTAGQGAERKGLGDRPMLRSQPHHPQLRPTCASGWTASAACWSKTWAWCRATACCCAAATPSAMALAWLAVVKAGLIAVATMPLLRARELGDIIDKAQPTRGAVRHQAAGRAGTRAQRTARCCATVVPFNALDEPGSLAVRVGAEGRRLHAPAPRPPTTSP